MASSGCAIKFTAAPTSPANELLNTEISNITKNDMQKITLNNGVEMPVMGYGVYQVAPDECERCVSDALRVGYRMIDTAQAYNNEKGVGAAVKESGIPREELFLVSKV